MSRSRNERHGRLLQPVVSKGRSLIQGTPLEHVARKVWKQVDERFVSDPANYRYTRQTVAIMKRALSKNSNCIDVGAAAGDVLQHIKRICPYGTHYAFEPIPSSYEKLAATFPDINTFDFALSGSSGEATFYVAKDDGYSSLRRETYSDSSEIAEVIQVKTARLDDVVPRHLPIHFIKVDVEGAELEVFRGAIDTIRRHKPLIIFEHQRGSNVFDSAIPREVYDFLTTSCGLMISLMESWLKSSKPLSREEFTESYCQRKDFMYIAHA